MLHVIFTVAFALSSGPFFSLLYKSCCVLKRCNIDGSNKSLVILLSISGFSYRMVQLEITSLSGFGPYSEDIKKL
jgi:hypothetical protein